MAFNSKDKENLKNIAEKIVDSHKTTKIRIPTGNKDDNKETEIQYDMMDMIIGLCGASMFGQTHKNRSSLESMISQPASWLGNVASIKDNVENIYNKIKDGSSVKTIQKDNVTLNNTNDYGQYFLALNTILEEIRDKIPSDLNLSVEELKYLSSLSALDNLSNDIAGALQKATPKAIVEFMIKSNGNLDLDKLNEFIKGINSSNIKGNIVKDLKDLGKTFQRVNDTFGNAKIDNIKKFIEIIKAINPNDMQNFVNAFTVDVSKMKDIKNLKKIIDDIEAFNKKLELIGHNNRVIKLAFGIINKEADLIKEVVDKFSEIDPNKIKEATNLVNSFAKLIITSSACIILGALVATFVPISKIITFGLTLAALVTAVSVPILVLNKFGTGKENKIFVGAKELSFIILACGAALAIGAFITQKIPISHILKFGLILAGFILAVSLPLIYFNSINRNVFKGLNSFTKLIIGASLTLLLGAAFMYIPGMVKAVLGFGLLLTGFIFLVTTAFSLGTLLIKQNLYVESLAGIIIGTAAALMIGGLFMMIPGMAKNVIKFGLLLTGFVLLITAAFGIASRLINNEMPAIKNFMLLTVISAGILMIGGLFMMIPGMAKATLEFALILGLFVTVTSLVFAGVSSMMSKNKSIVKDVLALGVLIALSALAMTLGPILLKLSGVTYKDVMTFCIMSIAYVGAFALMIWGLAQIKKEQLTQGTIALVAIAGVITVMTLVIGLIGDTVTKYPMGVILEGLADMGILIGATFAIALVIGAILSASEFTLAAVIAVGAAAILGIAGLLFTVTEMTVAIANSGILSVDFDKVNGALWSMAKLLGTVGLFITGVGLLTANPLVAIALTVGAATISGISGVILVTSLAIKQLGEAVKSISSSGLTPENVELIPTFLSYFMFGKDGKTGVFGIFDKFKGGILGNIPIIGAANTAGNMIGVVMSIKAVAEMITDISEAIQAFANLRAPIYSGGKIIGYRQLDTTDFENASESIETILTTIGGAVINTYERNQDMFDGTDWDNARSFTVFGVINGSRGTDTPFGRVIQSFRPVATLISEVSAAIQEYSKLGEKIKFDEAAKNINTVLTTIGQTIIDVYNNNKEMFDGSIVNNIADTALSFVNPIYGLTKELGEKETPFAKVTKSFLPIATLISEVSAAIQEYSKIGEKVDFDKAARNISTVLTTIGNAIISVYNNNKEIFDQSGWDIAKGFTIFGLFESAEDKDTPFARVTKSFLPVATLLTEMSKAIEAYASLAIPDYTDTTGKKKIKLTDTELKKTATNIGKVMTTIMQAVTDTYYNNENMFKGDWTGFGDSPIEKVGNAMKPVSEMIVTLAEAIKDYSSMKMPYIDENGKIVEGQYKLLKTTDFALAADNIETVITTILDAINRIYNKSEYANYFDRPWYELGMGDTPADKVSNAMKPIIELISGISNVIQQYAEMKIPQLDDSGKIVDGAYLQVNFVDVSNKIGQVLTTLFEAVNNTYKGKKDLFNSGWFEDSPVQKISKGLIPIVKVLGEAGKAIEMIASMKIPVVEHGVLNPKKFQEFDFNKLPKLNETITGIITSIFTSVNDAYKQVDDKVDFDDIDEISKHLGPVSKVIYDMADLIKQYSSLSIPYYDETTKKFDKSKVTLLTTGENGTIAQAAKAIKEVLTAIGGAITGVAKDETLDLSKLAKITMVLSPASKLISEIGKGLAEYASQKVPKEFNPDGSVKEWQPLTDAQISDAKLKIGEVITSLGTAIVNVAKADTTGVFDSGNFLQKGNKAGNIINTITKLSQILNGLAITIARYEKGEFPTFTINKDGQIVEGTPITLDEGNYTKAKEKIAKVLTTICEAMIDVYNNKTVKEFFENETLKEMITGGKDAKMNNIAVVIQSTSKMIDDISETFKKLVESYDKSGLTEYIESNEKSKLNNIKNSLNNFLGNSTNKNGLYGIIEQINNLNSFLDPASTEGAVAQFFKRLTDTQEKNSSEKATAVTGMISSIITQIESLTGAFKLIEIINIPNKEKIDGNITTLNTLLIGNKNANNKQLENGVLFELHRLNESIIDFDFDEPDAEKAQNVIDTLILSIKIIHRLNEFGRQKINADNIRTNLKTIINLISGITTEEKYGFIDVFKSFNDLITYINGNASNTSDTLNAFRFQNVFDIMSDLTQKISAWEKVFEDYNSESYESGKNKFIVSFEQVLKTIEDKLNNANNTEFAKHTNTLSKYVQSVNSINVTKVNSLTNLVNAMLQLSKNIKGLDEFNNTLANKLSEVLKKLTLQIIEAQKTIADADTLHKKREKLIKDSVKTIKSLLDSEMKVTVHSDQEEVSVTETEDKGNGGGTTDNTNLGTDGVIPKTTKNNGNGSALRGANAGSRPTQPQTQSQNP